MYDNETFLSLGPNSNFEEIEDISEVCTEPLSDTVDGECTCVGSVIGVKEVKRYPYCISCKERVETESSGTAFY